MLTPKSFNLDLIYKCDCGATHWITPEEAKTANFIIACDVCKKKDVLRTVESIKVLVNFKKDKKPHSFTSNISLIGEAYDVLKNYGFAKSELKELESRIKSTNVEDWVKKFLELKNV